MSIKASDRELALNVFDKGKRNMKLVLTLRPGVTKLDNVFGHSKDDVLYGFKVQNCIVSDPTGKNDLITLGSTEALFFCSAVDQWKVLLAFKP